MRACFLTAESGHFDYWDVLGSNEKSERWSLNKTAPAVGPWRAPAAGPGQDRKLASNKLKMFSGKNPVKFKISTWLRCFGVTLTERGWKENLGKATTEKET